MSKRDEDPFSFPSRHLRLVEDEDRKNSKEFPIPLGRFTRKVRPVERRRVNGDVEVPISHSTDLSDAEPGITPISVAQIPSQRGGQAPYSQLAEICKRIAEGYYNSPEVLDKVARRIIESGFLERTSMR